MQPTADPSHQTLISAIGRGSDAALEELYDLFERPLYALGLRALNDRQRAEELVQDTILKVWKSAPRYDPAKGDPKAWIFTIARRSAVDIIRREKRSPVPVDMTLHDSAEAGDPDDAWRAWEIAIALSALPETQRRVVELSVIEGFTHVEIADALQVPVGTIKTRIYAGLRKLRQRLQELEILEVGV